LSEFTEMDASVASRGVNREMPEQVGDGFERHAAAVKSRGQGVPEDMHSLVT
jgi:hypothetical protein